MKLYRAVVEVEVCFLADSMSHEVAREAAWLEVEAHGFSDKTTNVGYLETIDSPTELLPIWQRAIPWFSEDEKTCAQFLRSQQRNKKKGNKKK